MAVRFGIIVSAARPLRYTLPTFLDTPVNITAYRGTDVDLPCAVRNLGPKHVVWKKYNTTNPITVGDYVYDPDKSYEVLRPKTHGNPHWNLRITDVQLRHAGTYECQISTKEHFTRNVTLTVIETGGGRGANNQTGIRLDGSQFVEKGRSLVLNCTASAFDYRPKGVDWFKDGSKIKSDAHVLITESSPGENVLHSTLEVLRSNMSDAGTYVCRSSKLNVASKRVIVLNNSDGLDGITLGQPRSREHRPAKV
ncbi:MAM domain-containing glycosylphosphatidylinositol anchor protein 1-like [Babylonia areolata]|uniref:MAM domain-containing glycosylphosphatidylinositol anchor protein 1-like n=1 Tax=Babylonia areolata TaxID=304850 RepID=UPI003FD0681C